MSLLTRIVREKRADWTLYAVQRRPLPRRRWLTVCYCATLADAQACRRGVSMAQAEGELDPPRLTKRD